MRTAATSLIIAALLSAPAFSQVDRVLHFRDASSAQEIQEIAAVIRAITDIQQANVDIPEKSLLLHGTGSQVALGEWLFTNLDRSRSPNGAKREFQASNNADDIVRIFYLTNPQVPQGVQEIATAVRSLADIPRLFTYNELRAIAMRGTSEQVKLAEFLFAEMDKPAVVQTPSSKLHESSSPEFQLSAAAENAVRVFYLPNTKTVQEFQEVATLVRSIAEIRRLFTYNSARAISVRGNPDQLALAEWLFAELDRASTPQTHPDSDSLQYRASSSAQFPLVTLFYLTHAATAEALQQTATEVRTKTGCRYLFTYNAPRAIAIRGSAEQIAQAGRLIQDLDK